MERKKIKSIIKNITLFLFILVPITFFIIFIRSDFNISSFLNYFKTLESSLGIILFLFTIISASIGFPSLIPLIISALLLDYLSAVIVTYIGLVTGSVICFIFIRFLGKEFVDSKMIKMNSINRYKSRIESNGFTSILLIRLIILIPFELVNFASGLSKIKLKDYVLATSIGLLPGILISIYFIKSLNSIGSFESIIASIALSLIIIIPLISKKIRKYLKLDFKDKLYKLDKTI
ncbi:MAG TPA: VTT domain-containing protein [Candidatus Paceibacterota bacterium]|nr:VTT domain-containing protein [Candidatus Paceibacterota bacterium]